MSHASTRTTAIPAAPKGPWADSLGRSSIRAIQVLVLLALAMVVLRALAQVQLVIIPLLLALILAAAVGPLVIWLRRKGWPSAAATGFSFLLLLSAFTGLVTAIVVAVIGQAGELSRQAIEGFDQLYVYLQEGPLPLDDARIQQLRTTAVEFATSSTAGASAVTGISVIGNFLTGALLMAVILFFFLKDGEKIWAFVLRAFKGPRLVKARLVGHDSLAVLGGYVRGTAIVALVDAVFIGLALILLDVPLALPLTAVVFVGAFIPLVGATLAGILAALIALVANGPVTALIVVVVVIVVNQLEGNFLQPVVMGRTLSVHPLVILIALTAGTILAGIIGAILSVPLTAVAWAAIKAWNEYDDDEISAGTIEQAEYETLLDETGHGVSTLPDGEIPQLPAPGSTLDGVVTGEADGSDRPRTASRLDAGGNAQTQSGPEGGNPSGGR